MLPVYMPLYTSDSERLRSRTGTHLRRGEAGAGKGGGGKGGQLVAGWLRPPRAYAHTSGCPQLRAAAASGAQCPSRVSLPARNARAAST
jgi:hypothetical protein